MNAGSHPSRLAEQEFRASEILAAAWRERYVRGACDVEEMEAGVERALKGESTDREWLDLAHERRVLGLSPRVPPSLANVDSILRSAYRGPIAQ